MQTSDDLQHAFGFLWPVEPAVLRHLANLLPPSPKVVNIGAGVGTSALAFLEARDDLQLWTVDIEAGTTPFGGLGNERKVLEDAGLWSSGRARQIHSDSAKAGHTWPQGPVDLVFIDGDHTTPGVLRDIDAWLPRIREGGIIAFHDVGDRWLFNDVGKAVSERRKQFSDEVCRISLIQAFYTLMPTILTPCDRVEPQGYAGQPMTFVAYYPNMGGWLTKAEPETWEWCKKAIRQDWLCIDAGAHAGMYTMLFAQKASKGRVHAIEANPDAANMLRTNLVYNARFNYRFISHVRLTVAALAHRSGRFHDKVWLTGTEPSEAEWQFTTLDEWGAGLPRLDLLKTDLDSYDLDALVGAERLIAKHRPILLSEINYALAWRGHTEQQAADLLAHYNYDHRVLDRENWLCWPRESEDKRALCAL